MIAEYLKANAAYIAERNRLFSLNHPRIVALAANHISIDYWCDGNEQEAELVTKITRKLRGLFDKLERCNEKHRTIRS